MARYRGKHRQRPATSRTFARVALTGAVVAAPMAAAIPANAASESTWETVAQCESGGNWQISTGNGFSGGLQFTPSTWSSFGGSEYAANAKDATREQQIAVAERILQEQGPKAWPVCSKKAGLTSGSLENQDVSAGSGGSEQAQQSSDESEQSTTQAAPAPSSGGTYTVQAGDTLGKIGSKLGVSWQGVLDKNKGAIDNANTIFPGQQLKIG